MDKKLSRKKFLATVTGTSSLLLFSRDANSFQSHAPRESAIESIDQTRNLYFPSQDPELVQEMVFVAHGQTAKVKELLDAHPELSKAAWDWGFGDWETALGAASHTGSKEIAEMLMANGARPDIFTFTMLGNLGAVKAMIEGNPGFLKIRGPHGITLLAHAKIRLARMSANDTDKQKAQAMIDYLTSLGEADAKPASLEISDSEKKQFIGTFAFGEKPDEVFMVDVNDKGALYIKKPGQRFERPLLRVEANGFAPMGAPHVMVVFEVKDARATALTVNDPALVVRAVTTGH